MDESAINESVLNNCQIALRQFLDISEITPALGKYGMLTSSDRDFLSEQSPLTRVGKIDYILKILPSKGWNWFENFITALNESVKGTGSAHTDLVRTLRIEELQAKPGRTDLQILVQNEYYRFQASSYATETVLQAKKSNFHHLQATRPDDSAPRESASNALLKIADATHQIKQIVEDTQRQLLVLKNQIELVSFNKSLIQHMKVFRDALMSVQSFYVERFRNCATEKLSGKQLKMAKLIESLTGCDENFDVVKETEEWNKSLKLLEETYEDLEKVLFSLDESQIEQQQLQLKLEGETKEDASKWITDRESIVENGKACFDELVTLIDSNDKKESDLINHVKRRIDAGQKCLDLWRNWVDLRTSL